MLSSVYLQCLTAENKTDIHMSKFLELASVKMHSALRISPCNISTFHGESEQKYSGWKEKGNRPVGSAEVLSWCHNTSCGFRTGGTVQPSEREEHTCPRTSCWAHRVQAAINKVRICHWSYRCCFERISVLPFFFSEKVATSNVMSVNEQLERQVK